jgi:hypothetical protein
MLRPVKKPFSSKTTRIGSTRWVEAQLDDKVREILPLLESHCFTCSTTYGLQVGHLFERRWRHGRFDTSIDGNNHRQFSRCKANHEEHPEVYINKYIDRFGPAAYQALEFRVKGNQKLTYSDLLALLEEKQDQLNRLKGKRVA